MEQQYWIQTLPNLWPEGIKAGEPFSQSLAITSECCLCYPRGGALIRVAHLTSSSGGVADEMERATLSWPTHPFQISPRSDRETSRPTI